MKEKEYEGMDYRVTLHGWVQDKSMTVIKKESKWAKKKRRNTTKI